MYHFDNLRPTSGKQKYEFSVSLHIRTKVLAVTTIPIGLLKLVLSLIPMHYITPTVHRQHPLIKIMYMKKYVHQKIMTLYVNIIYCDFTCYCVQLKLTSRFENHQVPSREPETSFALPGKTMTQWPSDTYDRVNSGALIASIFN